MGGPDFVNVPNVQPGENVDVTVNLVAPARENRYRGYWRLQLPDGSWLAEQHYVEIVVEREPTKTPTPPPIPSNTPPPACGCDGDCGCHQDCGCDGDCGCKKDEGHYWHPN
jgi:hypothetical protein